MTRLPLARKKKLVAILVTYMDMLNKLLLLFLLLLYATAQRHYYRHIRKAKSMNNLSLRMAFLNKMIYESDKSCIEQLRMDRHTFKKLCSMLQATGRLKRTKNMNIEEMVAFFLHILAHHVKNRVIKNRFMRSGETISRHFNVVLNAVLRLNQILLKTPEPVPEDSTNVRWKWFKNCLGALDGTYIGMRVPEVDKPRYRSRKHEIATNVLGVCSPNMEFIYVLPGWEGSAADGRVLRDAISRINGLTIYQGYYYLVDAGYTNGEGFLAPYRGQRYHLNDWREGHQPTTHEEFFNMKHSAARNVIERCFGLLKLRWGILRSHSFYPVRTQSRIIMACCLLHNLIRREMPTDQLEQELDNQNNPVELHGDPIIAVEPSNEWSTWRTNLAIQMFNEWNANHDG